LFAELERKLKNKPTRTTKYFRIGSKIVLT
jgi:hypothetical protein